MLFKTRIYIALAALLPGVVAVSAQQAPQTANSATAAADQNADRSIHLDVAVTDKPGTLASALSQQDFTLLDNSAVQPITSFKAVGVGKGQAEVILIMDAVNAPFGTMAFEQDAVKKYLQSEGGRLAHPMTIGVLTDKGLQLQKGFSADGNELSHVLDGYSAGLREITRSTGYWGATERLQISLTGLQQLTEYAATLPGRKIVVWISPGWPLLSGVREELSQKQQDQIFHQITFFSALLRNARVTLYNINPRGVGGSLLNANYYKEFVKGIHKPSQTVIGNLGLQVLAVQSGGLVIESDNDVSVQLEKCVADTESWYEITFSMQPAERPDEYHHIEIKLDKPGMTARTRDGYYAQPEPRP